MLTDNSRDILHVVNSNYLKLRRGGGGCNGMDRMGEGVAISDAGKRGETTHSTAGNRRPIYDMSIGIDRIENG